MSEPCCTYSLLAITIKNKSHNVWRHGSRAHTSSHGSEAKKCQRTTSSPTSTPFLHIPRHMSSRASALCQAPLPFLTLPTVATAGPRPSFTSMLFGKHPFQESVPARDHYCHVIAVQGRLAELLAQWRYPISPQVIQTN